MDYYSTYHRGTGTTKAHSFTDDLKSIIRRYGGTDADVIICRVQNGRTVAREHLFSCTAHKPHRGGTIKQEAVQ